MRKLLYLWMFSMLVSASGVQAATFTVDNNGDIDNALGYVAADGTNTLRKCIRLANATAVLDTVLFNIPGPPYLITAATALIITRPVYIDGLSQPGAAPGNLIIELNGTNAVSNGALQLSGVNSSGSTIRGLVIYGSERGIYVNVSNNTTIICSHIGTNAGGTARIATPDTLLHGIYIINSQNTIIGGTGGIAERNIISGCGQNGIRIGTTSTGTVIMGNYIGTDITGTALIPNNQVTGGPYAGIFCATGSNNTTIGGPTSNYRNLISGNKQRGIYLQTSVSCLIRNNYIGTGISGNSSIPNINNGIETTTTCTGVMVLDNVISSNGQDGVKISASDNAVVKGNKIGLGSDGITQLGNGNHGLEILNSLSATIG
ncbi:MAG: right-handed parallel beta-helix repeat-containing protein, partial [Cytophagaceae bacterium]